MHFAIVILASLIALLAGFDHPCRLDGFPKISFKNGNIASNASGIKGVVAAWSA